VVDEAENRFHVQRAILDWLLNPATLLHFDATALSLPS
jgi:hypothetical protein